MVQVGNFKVPIYATPSHKGRREYPGFTARFRDANGVQRPFRASLDELRAEVKARVTPLAKGQSDCLVLRGAERAVFERAKREAVAMGLELDLAVVEIKAIRASAQEAGCLVEEAVKFWKRHHDHSKFATPVPQVVEAFLADRKEMGNSAEDIADLRHRLRRFAKEFTSPFRDITEDQYRRYFSSTGCGLRDRRNHRSVVRRCVNWAKNNGYLLAHHPGVPATGSKVRIPPKPIEVFDRERRDKMIQQARPVELPATLIAAYVPRRSKEIGLALWDAINWETGHLTIHAGGAKLRHSRTVYLVPKLRELLKPYRQASGRIYPFKNFDRVGPRLARKAGIKWIRNGWRCTVISHLQAFVRCPERVAYEAMTSQGVMEEHYLKDLSPEVGRAYFGLAENDRHPLEPFPGAEERRLNDEIPESPRCPANVILFPCAASVVQCG